jgi:hypothetical protein
VTSACILFASLLLQPPPVSLDLPDSVQAGSQFTITLVSIDQACTGISCSPAHSTGLSFLTARSSRSYSSSTVGGRTLTEQSSTLCLVYRADEAGIQWIGPFRAILGPPGVVTLPAESIFVTGGDSVSRAAAHPSGRRLWVETEPAPGPYLSGVPFRVNYYLNTTSFVKDVESYWCPPRNGMARLLDAPDIVAWQVASGGSRRTKLLTLEITPAGAGELILPVVQARISLYSLPPWGGGGTQDIYGDTLALPVSSFPGEFRPANFTGFVDSVFLDLHAERPEGESEWTALLALSGPGRESSGSPPQITVHGPARLLDGPSGEDDAARWWEFVVCPYDSGTVILGPDSVAWLDRGTLSYRQAGSRACTLEVNQVPLLCDSAVACTTALRKRSLLPAYLAAFAALLPGLFFFLKWRSNRRRACSIREAGDAEELLTAFEAALSRTLTGRIRPLGVDGVEESMESCGVPQMLRRQVLRNWRDLEQLLGGGSVTAEQVERARSSSSGILEELDNCLSGLRR